MEKIRSVTKQTDNPFLNMYKLDAVKRDGGVFGYYVASRSDKEDMKLVTHKNAADGVAIYGVAGEKHDRLVLVRQYRYPIDDYIYELPAGILEKGEDPTSAAIREFKEETGMDLAPFTEGDACYRKPFFTTVGLTDESVACVYGFANGTPGREYLEDTEDLEVVLADREEVRRILREENVAMICALFMLQFLAAADEEPFAFLM